jgi:hypothetical protein
MTTDITDAFGRLRVDEWRSKEGFSDEIESFQTRLFAPEGNLQDTFNDWLKGKNQPCLFGRAAASQGRISYCILVESDILKGNVYVRDKIQAARKGWWKQSFDGASSAFVLAVVSRRISEALPDDNMAAFARIITSLYLMDDVEHDRVYMDELFLERPGKARTTWRWKVGVNYFCAQGDKRWWCDHRIPGGMALSSNSVGHLVKSGALVKAMKALESAVGGPSDNWVATPVDSLETALVLAMRTIGNAADGPSGKVTRLRPLETGSLVPRATCPFSLPKDLQSKSYCLYDGDYHTDYTLPKDYFKPDVLKPVDGMRHELEFTYLFEKNDSAYVTMGDGEQIRGVKEAVHASQKRRRVDPDEGPITAFENLLAALE